MIGFALRVGVLLVAGLVGTYWLYVLAVRKRGVFAGLGAVLVVWGAWVYAPENAGAGWAWREGWNEGSAAANKAVSAFFPSRGDYDAPIVPPGRCYWAFHTAAILYMLSLAVAVFGVELVNRGLVAWRGWLPFQWSPRPAFRRRELNVVWGLGEEGRQMADGLVTEGGKKSVVFAVEESGGGWFDLKEAGGALRVLTRTGWTWVLGRVERPGVLGRARRHFFLGPDGYGNAARAEALMRALRKEHRYRTVTVYVRTWTDADDDAVHACFDAWVDKLNQEMQSTGVQVEVVREEAIVARKFRLDHPMLDVPGVKIDTESVVVHGQFRVLLAGFGAQGRRLLAEMVEDAQFLGPNTKVVEADGKERSVTVPVTLEVDVVDPNDTSWGWFKVECADACQRYHIRFHPWDVRKASFWTWLEAQPAYNRVVLATQSDDINLEAAGRVANAYKICFPAMRGQTGKVVFTRVRDHVLAKALRKATDDYELFGETAEIYAPDVILHGHWDEGAIRINGLWAASYRMPPRGEAERAAWYREQWQATSTFNKESSRASFFLQRNMLRLAGFKVFDTPQRDEDLAVRGLKRVNMECVKAWLQKDGCLEKLAEMEHMRWLAFHLLRGWRRWRPTQDELATLAQTHGNALKPNMLKKIVPLHADLADYRELVEVDALFNAVNRSHGWQEVDSVKKDKDIVYGVEAMFNAGFTVAEKVQVELATAEAEEGEKDSGDKGWWTK